MEGTSRSQEDLQDWAVEREELERQRVSDDTQETGSQLPASWINPYFAEILRHQGKVRYSDTDSVMAEPGPMPHDIQLVYESTTPLSSLHKKQYLHPNAIKSRSHIASEAPDSSEQNTGFHAPDANPPATPAIASNPEDTLEEGMLSGLFAEQRQLRNPAVRRRLFTDDHDFYDAPNPLLSTAVPKLYFKSLYPSIVRDDTLPPARDPLIPSSENDEPPSPVYKHANKTTAYVGKADISKPIPARRHRTHPYIYEINRERAIPEQPIETQVSPVSLPVPRSPDRQRQEESLDKYGRVRELVLRNEIRGLGRFDIHLKEVADTDLQSSRHVSEGTGESRDKHDRVREVIDATKRHSVETRCSDPDSSERSYEDTSDGSEEVEERSVAARASSVADAAREATELARHRASLQTRIPLFTVAELAAHKLDNEAVSRGDHMLDFVGGPDGHLSAADPDLQRTPVQVTSASDLHNSRTTRAAAIQEPDSDESSETIRRSQRLYPITMTTRGRRDGSPFSRAFDEIFQGTGVPAPETVRRSQQPNTRQRDFPGVFQRASFERASQATEQSAPEAPEPEQLSPADQALLARIQEINIYEHLTMKEFIDMLLSRRINPQDMDADRLRILDQENWSWIREVHRIDLISLNARPSYVCRIWSALHEVGRVEDAHIPSYLKYAYFLKHASIPHSYSTLLLQASTELRQAILKLLPCYETEMTVVMSPDEMVRTILQGVPASYAAKKERYCEWVRYELVSDFTHFYIGSEIWEILAREPDRLESLVVQLAKGEIYPSELYFEFGMVCPGTRNMSICTRGYEQASMTQIREYTLGNLFSYKYCITGTRSIGDILADNPRWNDPYIGGPLSCDPLKRDLLAIEEWRLGYLMQLPDNVLISWTGVYPAYSGRAQLVRAINRLYESPSFFIPVDPKRRYAENKVTVTGLTEVTSSEVPMLAYGTWSRYQVYEYNDLIESCRCMNDVLIARHPEDPRKYFTKAELMELLTLLKQGESCDEGKAELYQAIEDVITNGLDMSSAQDRTKAVIALMDQKNKDIMRQAFHLMFCAGLYMRRWKGPGHTFPLLEEQTNKGPPPDKQVGESVISMLELRDKLQPEEIQFFNELITINIKAGRLVAQEESIKRMVEGVLSGKECIRMASTVYMGTACYYASSMFNETLLYAMKDVDNIS
jgi:hypothetical protein